MWTLAEIQGRVFDLGVVTGSENVVTTAAGVPLVFWFLGGVDPDLIVDAMETVHQPDDIPSDHSPFSPPIIEPTFEDGVTALVAAAREWFGTT